MTNESALNHDTSLQIYFFCVKRQSKNDFLKDVESTVGTTLQVVIMSLFGSLFLCSNTNYCSHILGYTGTH